MSNAPNQSAPFASPLRLLVLDRDPDAPRWMIMSAVLSSDTMPAEISHKAGIPRGVTSVPG